MSGSDERFGANGPADGVDAVTRLQLELMKDSHPGLRGQHYKQHGVVRAQFRTLDDIPKELKVGLFAQPGTYPAWVRFSNGSQFDDTKADIHGMAIKLMGVEGRKILEEESTADTHDFVLADHPVFFIRDTDEYVRFMKNFAQTAPKGKRPLQFMLWLLFHHPKDLLVLLRFRRQIQASPLAAQYWSQVPYAFGLEGGPICRYSVTPHAHNLSASTPSGTRGPNYLKQSMLDHLTISRRPADFDFNVQLHNDSTPKAIDNPTVVWDDPVHRVAVITISPQEFDTPKRKEFGENLSYTPWHALPEHRPLGQINQIRKAVYLASSSLRHDTNHAPRSEPSPPSKEADKMRLSYEELTANIDDDFKAVVDKLQHTFNYMAEQVQKGRATHTYGVVAKGEARCVAPADFPENDTFVFGKVFPIILRHSSPGGRADDRARDGVAASIKFFEPGGGLEGDGIYDVLMNAGRQLFVRNIRDFSTFVHTPDAERIKLVQQGLMLEPQLVEAYRIRGSFTDFRYYTWVCFEFIDKKGVSRYVRLRLINHDRGLDRGLPNAAFHANGRPSMEPVADDQRAPDFLRKDFLYKVKYSDVRYILQAQFRDAPNPPDVNHELFDPSQPWNEYWYPWMDMFEIRLTETIEDYEAIAHLEMNPNRSPFCIRIPLATSPDHFASLGHARAIIYPGARAARAAVPPPQNN